MVIEIITYALILILILLTVVILLAVGKAFQALREYRAFIQKRDQAVNIMIKKIREKRGRSDG